MHRTKILKVLDADTNTKSTYVAICSCGFIGAEMPYRDGADNQANRHFLAAAKTVDPRQLELPTARTK